MREEEQIDSKQNASVMEKAVDKIHQEIESINVIIDKLFDKTNSFRCTMPRCKEDKSETEKIQDSSPVVYDLRNMYSRLLETKEKLTHMYEDIVS